MTDINSAESNFNSSVDGLKKSFSDMKSLISKAEDEANSEYSKLKKEHEALQGKYKDAQSKVDHIEGQLSEAVNRLESMSKTTAKGVNAMELLDVYLVLMEQVFESGPHVRLLLMLHGDKEEYSLQDLVVASGISAIQVRQAIHELRNAGVLSFDDETQIAKLKQRFLG